jgi:hypothetical protein
MTNYTYGKFLIIHDYIKPNKAELKRLLKSSFVDELKLQSRNSDDEYFSRIISEAFRIADKPLRHKSYKIYRVDDTSVSTFYALREEYIASISFTEDEFNKLDLALDLFNGINNAKGNVYFWQNSHDRLLQQFSNTKIPHSYDLSMLDFSHAIEHDRVYGTALLSQAIDDIKNLSKNSW